MTQSQDKSDGGPLTGISLCWWLCPSHPLTWGYPVHYGSFFKCFQMFSPVINFSKIEAMYQPAQSKVYHSPIYCHQWYRDHKIKEALLSQQYLVQQWIPRCRRFSVHCKSEQCLWHSHTKILERMWDQDTEEDSSVLGRSLWVHFCTTVKHGLCIVATSSSLSSSTSPACTASVASNGGKECPTCMF